MLSQNLQILRDLKRGHKITPLDALTKYGTLRLSARIYDIRERGYNVISTPVERNGKTVAMYNLGDG